MTVSKIYKTERIIKVSPEDTLSHIFSLFTSAHDAAFVIDEENNFLGVINPYYCVIVKSYPSNTKAKHCLIHPPKVDINFPLKKVARLIIDSKIHFLPVFSNNQFQGIISARRILEAIRDLKEMKMKISQFLKGRKPLISVFEDDYLSKAVNLFKQHRVSKVIVLSKNLKLKGLLSYFDLISYLVTPKEKQQSGAREGNKIPFLKRPVKNFMHNNVVTGGVEAPFNQVIDTMLERQIGSVVIIDKERHPLGIITTRDFLSLFIKRREWTNVQVMTKNLSRKSWLVLSQFIHQINHHLAQGKNVIKAKLFVEEKTGKGLFRAILSLFLRNKPIKVITKEGKNLGKVLKEVKDKNKD